MKTDLLKGAYTRQELLGEVRDQVLRYVQHGRANK